MLSPCPSCMPVNPPLLAWHVSPRRLFSAKVSRGVRPHRSRHSDLLVPLGQARPVRIVPCLLHLSPSLTSHSPLFPPPAPCPAPAVKQLRLFGLEQVPARSSSSHTEARPGSLHFCGSSPVHPLPPRLFRSAILTRSKFLSVCSKSFSSVSSFSTRRGSSTRWSPPSAIWSVVCDHLEQRVRARTAASCNRAYLRVLTPVATALPDIHAAPPSRERVRQPARILGWSVTAGTARSCALAGMRETTETSHIFEA